MLINLTIDEIHALNFAANNTLDDDPEDVLAFYGGQVDEMKAALSALRKLNAALTRHYFPVCPDCGRRMDSCHDGQMKCRNCGLIRARKDT